MGWRRTMAVWTTAMLTAASAGAPGAEASPRRSLDPFATDETPRARLAGRERIAAQRRERAARPDVVRTDEVDVEVRRNDRGGYDWRIYRGRHLHFGSFPAAGHSEGGLLPPRLLDKAVAEPAFGPTSKLTFEERLVLARVQFSQADPATTLEALASRENRDDARTFAALERAHKLGVTVPEETLTTILRRSHADQTLFAAVWHLGRYKTSTARTALAEYVARGGREVERARPYLGPDGDALVEAARVRLRQQQEWMERAAHGRPGSGPQRRALEALAEVPGEDVTTLIVMLANDLSRGLSKPATRILAERRRAGIE